jgi:hypothetical protein
MEEDEEDSPRPKRVYDPYYDDDGSDLDDFLVDENPDEELGDETVPKAPKVIMWCYSSWKVLYALDFE